MFDDTRRLIEGCINREERAWETFIERFSGLLYYSARERLRKNGIAFARQDLEDIVQSVFVELWERGRLKEVRDRGKIKAYLSIMAQTRALNYIRSRKERTLSEDELFKMDNITAGAFMRDDKALMRELETAMEGFGAKEKIVLKLNIIHGKKHRDIARFMVMPINTVSTIIARKKKILKERLKNL